MASPHGTLNRYRAGCHCALCRQKNTDYTREANRRARARRAKENAPGEPGPAESAAKAEVQTLKAAEASPTLVQIALAMARILDTPGAPNKPSAAKQLTQIIALLRSDSAKAPAGRLALVRSMTQRAGG